MEQRCAWSPKEHGQWRKVHLQGIDEQDLIRPTQLHEGKAGVVELARDELGINGIEGFAEVTGECLFEFTIAIDITDALTRT